MARVLGSPVPQRFGNASTVPSFPQIAETYTDPTGAIIVPGALLDSFFAWRALFGATRGDIIGVGDSTLYGSGALYSIMQRLRDRAIEFGLADGGKGMFAGGESSITYDAPEINGFVSNSDDWGGGFPDQFDNLDGQYYYDTGSPAGNTLTLQFRSTGARLWFSQRANTGDFTYAVDGGDPVTVHAFNATDGFSEFVSLTGYEAGMTHTLVVTNLGGRAAVAPINVNAGQNGPSSGTLASGTYYYVATYEFDGGETLASEAVACVVGGGGRSVTISVPVVGQDSTNIYRGMSPAGPFGFLTSAVASGNDTIDLFADDGSITPSGTNPPVSGTTNLNTSATACYIALAPVNATGFAVQKMATSGDTIAARFFAGTPTSPFTQSESLMPSQTALGLATTVVAAPDYMGAPRDTSHDEDGGRLTPVFAMCNLGFNDLTDVSDQDTVNAMCTEAVKKFAGACKDAGCPGFWAVGQLAYNANWPTYGVGMFNALKTQALASGLGFGDLLYPVEGVLSLDYSGGTNNPHLTKEQYQAQADFLWNGLLGVT